MHLSVNWIHDYLNGAKLAPKELANQLTLKVAEVESLTSIGHHLEQVFTAKVLAISPHPSADRLKLVEIDLGLEKKTVVCGADNFKLGNILAYAAVGASLPQGLTIKARLIRGVESLGMLCSPAELGFSGDDQGLMLLADDLQPGLSLAVIYPDQLDSIILIDNKSITHRPDLWGHFGFAREIAALYELKQPKLSLQHDWLASKAPPLINVEIVDNSAVPKLHCQGFSNITVRPSVDFIQHRLHRVGLRPINNLVDITNYIMLDLGQPMHAFDVAKVPSKKLTIKFAKPGQKLLTLYNKLITLDKSDLLFWNQNEPTALCGVIGGLDSGIGADTKDVFFEAGVWRAELVRRTAIRHGLRTDAVQRYEKSLDPQTTIYAIDKAWQLLKASCPQARITGGLLQQEAIAQNPVVIDYQPAQAEQLLGAKISPKLQQDILTRLGFIVNQQPANWQVTVPSWRATKDVSQAADLVEEIGRLFGYSNIKPQAPNFLLEAAAVNIERKIERQLKSDLAALGFNEVLNYPLTNSSEELSLGGEIKNQLAILNPSAADQNLLKTQLAPHFLQAIAVNQPENPQFKLFELAKVYQDSAVVEKKQLILGFSAIDDQKYGENFISLISDLKTLSAGLPYGQWSFATNQQALSIAHPQLSSSITCQKKRLGAVFQLHPHYKRQLGLKYPVFLAIIDFDLLTKLPPLAVQYQPASRFPPVYFDLSLVVPERFFYQELADKISNISPAVDRVQFVDRFSLPDQQVSLTVQIVFRAKDKTFSSTEVTALQDLVITKLAAQGIKLRQ